jgi:hypothetical protein
MCAALCHNRHALLADEDGLVGVGDLVDANEQGVAVGGLPLLSACGRRERA